MRKILVLLLCLTLWQAIWAAEVVSVRSTDRDNNSNTVDIQLSDATQYRTEKLPGGKGIRLIIQNVDKLGSTPDYPRLSEVVDKISARMEGSNAIIDIKTMGNYNISHHTGSDRRRISVSINAGPTAKEVVSAPKSEPAPKAKTEIPERAMPRKADEPELVRGQPPLPPPTLGRLRTENEPEAAEKPHPDEAEAEEDKQAPQPQKDTFDEYDDEDAEDSPVDAQQTEKKKSPALWLFIAAAALLSLVVIFQFFIKKDRQKEMGSPTVVTPPSPKEGHTLLLDPETRKRMVQKLLDQGWSTAEIAREIRLNPDQVEQIVADLRKNG